MNKFFALFVLAIASFACNNDDELTAEERSQVNEEAILAYLADVKFEDNYLSLTDEDDTSGGLTDKFTRTEDGIYYWIREQGTGIAPAVADSIQVHYRGTTISGGLFDSSLNGTGAPSWLELGSTIEGWQKFFPLLKARVGKGELDGYVNQAIVIIPSQLAYGASIQQGLQHTNLVFEVELYDVELDTDSEE